MTKQTKQTKIAIKKANRKLKQLLASITPLREKAQLAAPFNPNIVAQTEDVIAKGLAPIIDLANQYR